MTKNLVKNIIEILKKYFKVELFQSRIISMAQIYLVASYPIPVTNDGVGSDSESL